jgi:alcohol dehydrogenase class IV
MDALTHAVESFIGGWSTAYTRNMSLSATEKIFKQLPRSYRDGGDLAAREAMLVASFEAGLAFTRANVGYVHAIAHQLGGMFHTPHGDANAMLLPHVLDFFVKDEQPGLFSRTPITDNLAQLAAAAGLTGSIKSTRIEKREAAEKFIARIKEMNVEMNIPTEIKDMKAVDVDEVAKRALTEAHGARCSLMNFKSYIFDLGYPVPTYMTHTECARIVAAVLTPEENRLWNHGVRM